ncbi:MAG TPA: hypothetical protein VII06_31850 [Chloroflexota bacterium]|jgi:hypothetical protein
MQSTGFRCLALVGILAAANWLLVLIGGPSAAEAARWPTDDRLYTVDDWFAGPAAVEDQHGVTFVTRRYHSLGGATATLVVATSPEAKRVYRAAPDVPFLGSGYATAPASPSVVPGAPGRDAVVVSRGNVSELLLYGYGERRGLLGNGVLGWGLVFLDGVLGQPNDYYQVSLVTPLERPDAPVAPAVVALADTLFPRLASWYGD